jgi:hypothetical protein
LTELRTDANRAIEGLLNERIVKIEQRTEADVLSFNGPIFDGVEEYLREILEDANKEHDKLLVVLETHGGSIRVVERIVNIFRHHYDTVEFLIPNFAMSAGTVLVMSGNAIYMDYFSVLGPIDPQLLKGDGKLVPALGYLHQYDRLIKKSEEGTLTTAELTYLIQNFDLAELYQFEQEVELTISLLKDWLVKYKFANWIKTETRGNEVTNRMRVLRAGAIARQLNNTKRWRSHGRGIPMAVLRNELKLKIEDFGEDKALNSEVQDHYTLKKSYMQKLSSKVAIHVSGLYMQWR